MKAMLAHSEHPRERGGCDWRQRCMLRKLEELCRRLRCCVRGPRTYRVVVASRGAAGDFSEKSAEQEAPAPDLVKPSLPISAPPSPAHPAGSLCRGPLGAYR